jgi:hypothetical protein
LSTGVSRALLPSARTRGTPCIKFKKQTVRKKLRRYLVGAALMLHQSSSHTHAGQSGMSEITHGSVCTFCAALQTCTSCPASICKHSASVYSSSSFKKAYMAHHPRRM